MLIFFLHHPFPVLQPFGCSTFGSRSKRIKRDFPKREMTAAATRQPSRSSVLLPDKPSFVYVLLIARYFPRVGIERRDRNLSNVRSLHDKAQIDIYRCEFYSKWTMLYVIHGVFHVRLSPWFTYVIIVTRSEKCYNGKYTVSRCACILMLSIFFFFWRIMDLQIVCF